MIRTFGADLIRATGLAPLPFLQAGPCCAGFILVFVVGVATSCIWAETFSTR